MPRGLVLGIESSCDDTGVAVMTPEGHILGQALATQADVHRCASRCFITVAWLLNIRGSPAAATGDTASPDQIKAAGMVALNFLVCTPMLREWGGVVPTLAMEAHSAAIDATVDTALANAGVSAADLAAVAVTVGPGLVMCLQARKAHPGNHIHHGHA